MIAQNIVNKYDEQDLQVICQSHSVNSWNDYLDKLYTTYVFSDGSTITLSEDGFEGMSF